MNLKKLISYIAFVASVMGVTVFMQSCREERFDVPDYTRTGEEVILNLDITMPVMDTKTRADLDAASLNQVESLWIRTYSAESGKATSEWYKAEEQPGFNGNIGVEDDSHEVTIKTQSGSSYIIAVANVDNLGVTKDFITTRRPLRDLLEEADTWTDFLNIAVVAPYTQDNVRAPLPPLPMAGCFSDIIVGGQHPEPARIDEWQVKDFQPYFIPVKEGVVDFTETGAIHLRRLVSHLNFNVIPGDNVDIIVNSYQVMNAPRFSWLYERPDVPGVLTANFGDQATSEDDVVNYYADVPQFGSQFITVNADGSSSFDFWQAENKHDGTSETYTDRDLKEGTLFKSLTGDSWTPDNEASYVLIQCTVDYKDPLNVNQQGVITPDGTQVYRSGEVTYIVHLGYVKGDSEELKSKDFNCYRNVDYTYNLNVNGIDDIRLDAHALDATDEVYHGEEGLVVDLANSTIDIDAHYAVFNIQLSETELTGEFGFMITAYENGNQITVTEANTQQGSGSTIQILDRDGTVIDPKYYNWIELRPTTQGDVLAPYRPRYGANSDGSTFLLTDLKGGWDRMTDAMKSQSGWYTVYVNEYSYEPMYTGTNGYADEHWDGSGGKPNWMGYVNQNPRRFYIKVTQSISPDHNSIYSRSKYGVSQQSMMSYYSDANITEEGTAIGVERENETLGMNLRHTFAGGTSTSNGRWNTAQWLNGDETSTNLSINNNNQNNRPQWSNFIQEATPLKVGAVTELRAQGGSSIPGGTFRLPGVVIMTGVANQGYTFNDPQGSNNYTIQAINACMSRNRDNNGNGRIEPDELRWYVPAMDQYLFMMLGSKSLPEPMMPYQTIESLPHVANDSYTWTTANNYRFSNDYCSRYMYVSSNANNCVMWVMEGTSISYYNSITDWAGTTIRPWQVRCIRNLGSNLTTVTNENKVEPPYVHNTASRKFLMTYYDLASIRTNAYTGNGTGASQMPVHTIASSDNTTYYGFEYTSEDNDIRVPVASRPAGQANFSTAMTAYINGNPCADLGTGWRVPNQEELTIMRNAGVFSSGYGANDMLMSCTVNYFNAATGAGSLLTDGKLFLVVNPANGTQATTQNISNAGNNVFIRCVRDVNN